MFSACLFCHLDLGANETLEAFPVGRRLAYDPARGRLWVVCPHCARWNLSPLEERWEAIEEAERRFEHTRLRAGTGEITLARLREGTELVRIGRPPRLELAAWRYGDQLGRRRKQQLLIAGGVMAGSALVLAGAVSSGVGLVTAWQAGNLVYRMTQEGAPWATVARVRAPSGDVIRVRPGDLHRAQLGAAPDGSLQITLHPSPRTLGVRRSEIVTYTGAQAERILGQLLPAVNRLGGTKEEVRLAIERLERAGEPEAFFASLARRGRRLTPLPAQVEGGVFGWRKVMRRQLAAWTGEEEDAAWGLYALPRTLGLATEMAAHEEQERLALEGDVAQLEAAWREAEEIARIADDLLLPAEVEARLASLRERGEGKATNEGNGGEGRGR
jgi:hypothetical protein